MADIFLVSNRIHVGLEQPKNTSKAWLRQELAPYKLLEPVTKLFDNTCDVSSIIDEDARFGFTAYITEDIAEHHTDYLVYKNGTWLPIFIENSINIDYDGNRLTIILPDSCSYEYDGTRVTLDLIEDFTVNYSDGKVSIEA